jgi:hypothetical protein
LTSSNDIDPTDCKHETSFVWDDLGKNSNKDVTVCSKCLMCLKVEDKMVSNNDIDPDCPKCGCNKVSLRYDDEPQVYYMGDYTGISNGCKQYQCSNVKCRHYFRIYYTSNPDRKVKQIKESDYRIMKILPNDDMNPLFKTYVGRVVQYDDSTNMALIKFDGDED